MKPGCQSPRPRKVAPRTTLSDFFHQRYLARNINGYCGLGGTGVSCPVGLDLEEPTD